MSRAIMGLVSEIYSTGCSRAIMGLAELGSITSLLVTTALVASWTLAIRQCTSSLASFFYRLYNFKCNDKRYYCVRVVSYLLSSHGMVFLQVSVNLQTLVIVAGVGVGAHILGCRN